MADLSLLPVPQQFAFTGGYLELTDGRLILLDAPHPQALRGSAARFQRELRGQFGLAWEMIASPAAPADQIGLVLRVCPEEVKHPQGYELDITPDGIRITGDDDAGVFYGVCSLIQIARLQPPASLRLPTLHISDWPDYPARGVSLDVSRDKVPSMETLYGLIDMLAGWKINQVQLYTEHTFAYRQHPEVWAKASPLTGQEIMDLDAYCRERYIELVPNQNSFGHMHRWLIHPRYKPLAEAPNGFDSAWGHHDEPFSLCPVAPGSLELVRSLYDELLPHFSSRMFNVGCDETIDLGLGGSKAACQEHGTGRVYLEFLKQIYAEVNRRSHTMQFWGDIITQHPELIPELPRDAIALEWGYEAGHPFDAHGAQFAAAGIPFYVCPGTSSWCSLAGRTDNALANLLDAAENGLKHGAIGYLNTDWGDNGHWQPLPVSYLGLALGAGYSWALAANRALDPAQTVSWHAFGDPTGTMGRVVCDLGNVYKVTGIQRINSSALFLILQWRLARLTEHPALPEFRLQETLDCIDAALAPLAHVRMARPDADLVKQEYGVIAHMMRHACRRAEIAREGGPRASHAHRREMAADMESIICDYEPMWLARNRPGGLADSIKRLRKAQEDYA